MIKLEDILDDAVRYLRAEMDTEERSFFEELLNQHPHLWEELRFAQLIRLGLKQLSEKEELEKRLKKRKRWRTIALLTLLFLLLTSVLIWQYNRLFPNIPSSKIPIAEAVSNGNVPKKDAHSIVIHNFGGSNGSSDADQGRAVCWNHWGDVYFAANFEGEGTLGPFTFKSNGDRDFLFGTYNFDNGFNWVTPLGAAQTPDIPQDIATDSENNLVLTGSFGGEVNFGRQMTRAKGQDDFGNRDFFIAKYTPNGRLLWVDHGGGHKVKHQQTGVNAGLKVATDSKDHVVALGMYVGTPTIARKELPLGGPNEDLFLCKYNPGGSIQWIKTITGSYAVQGFGLDTDNQGNIYIAGFFGHHNLGGQVYFGNDTLTSNGGRDIFIAKYSPQGDVLWIRQAGSDQKEQGIDMAKSLVVDEKSNVIISGAFTGKAKFGELTLESAGGWDIFTAKYTTKGEITWAKRAGSTLGSGPKAEMSNAVAVDKDGGIVCTGSFTDKIQFGNYKLHCVADYNFFLAKYDAEGNVLWAKQFDELHGVQRAAGMDVDVDANGRIVVTGFFSGAVRIDQKELKSKGKSDIFILHFDKTGHLLSANSIISYL